MDTSYDVIVVGAGLGGMSAATLLAHKGYKVLLLEKHNIPGGYATSFVRGRFEFEVSLHVLSDLGTPDDPGNLRRYLDKLDVTRRLEIVQVPDMYHSIFPGLEITLPLGWEPFTDKLCDKFPHDAMGIKCFIDRVRKVSKELKWMQDIPFLPPKQALAKAARIPFTLRAFPRYLLATWGEVLERDVIDEKARAVLSQTWGYYGLPPSKVSFIYFAVAMASFLNYGAWHIKGRSQALSAAFMDSFKEKDGVLKTNSGVKQILVNNGKVAGVITEDGQQYQADYVVSNADPISTCRGMIGLDKIPASFFKGLSHLEPSNATFLVFMGLAKTQKQLGIESYETFINEDYDLDKHHEKAFGFDPPGMVIRACYNDIMPDISPKGTSIVSLTAMAYGKPWMSLDPELYVERKNQVADHMIEMTEKYSPGLRDAIEVVEVATPLTNMRFAGHLEGAIYGFSNYPISHTVLRPTHFGPVDGLFFAGAWTQPGGGFSPAIFSGQYAGSMVAAKLAKKLEG